jgi:hypothetical protein
MHVTGWFIIYLSIHEFGCSFFCMHACDWLVTQEPIHSCLGLFPHDILITGEFPENSTNLLGNERGEGFKRDR